MAEQGPRVFESLSYDDRKWSFRDKFRDGARRSFLRSGSLIRMRWATLDNISPEDIPWAEPNGNDPGHVGRVGVVRATWSAIGDAGGLNTETAAHVAVREWEGKVQVSNHAEPDLFEWGDNSIFTAAVFAESDEGRVAIGIKSGPSLAIPEGLVLVEQLSPAQLAREYPDLPLAA